jgi:hypothetical protein
MNSTKQQNYETSCNFIQGYAARRVTFNGICTARPAFIVVPTTAAQVAAVVVAAKQNNMEIR